MLPFPMPNFNWYWQHWHWQHFHIGNIFKGILITVRHYPLQPMDRLCNFLIILCNYFLPFLCYTICACFQEGVAR